MGFSEDGPRGVELRRSDGVRTNGNEVRESHYNAGPSPRQFHSSVGENNRIMDSDVRKVLFAPREIYIEPDQNDRTNCAVDRDVVNRDMGIRPGGLFISEMLEAKLQRYIRIIIIHSIEAAKVFIIHTRTNQTVFNLCVIATVKTSSE